MTGPIRTSWNVRDYIWFAATELIFRLGLLKFAPGLQALEMRRPVHGCKPGWYLRDEAPAVWAQLIPQLSTLRELRTIQLSFPTPQGCPSDVASIAAAREVLTRRRVQTRRKLVIRRVLAPGWMVGQVEDITYSSTEEVFE